MSRVITFSRQFPATHPKKGQATYFIEKLHRSLDIGVSEKTLVSKEMGEYFNFAVFSSCEPKHHTIRGGNRWKVGDKFSPRVWSGKPYASKQIIIAPDIEIKKIWTFEMDASGYYWIDGMKGNFEIEDVAKNDGLSKPNFDAWFAIHPKAKNQTFAGQILCWNESIEYGQPEQSNSRLNNQLARNHAAVPENG